MRYLWLLSFAACTPDPRGQCVNTYLDHYTYSTSIDSKGMSHITSSPVYECDVWVRVNGDSVIVSRKPGHNRIITGGPVER